MVPAILCSVLPRQAQPFMKDVISILDSGSAWKP